MRRGEAVAGRDDRATSRPRDVDVDATGAELHRRDAGCRRGLRGRRPAAPPPRRPRRTARGTSARAGCWPRRPAWCRGSRPRRRSRAAARTIARSCSLRLMLTTCMPCSRAQRMPAWNRAAAAPQVGAEHPDAVDLGVRRERPDDAAHAVPCPTRSSCGPSTDAAVRRLGVELERDRAGDPADARMLAVDTAVDHRDLDAGAGRPAPGPLPVGRATGSGSPRRAPGPPAKAADQSGRVIGATGVGGDVAQDPPSESGGLRPAAAPSRKASASSRQGRRRRPASPCSASSKAPLASGSARVRSNPVPERVVQRWSSRTRLRATVPTRPSTTRPVPPSADWIVGSRTSMTPTVSPWSSTTGAAARCRRARSRWTPRRRARTGCRVARRRPQRLAGHRHPAGDPPADRQADTEDRAAPAPSAATNLSEPRRARPGRRSRPPRRGGDGRSPPLGRLRARRRRSGCCSARSPILTSNAASSGEGVVMEIVWTTSRRCVVH